MGKYKYLVLSFGALLVMIVRNPGNLMPTFVHEEDYAMTAAFEPQHVDSYSSGQLKMYLSNSHSLEASNIISAAKALAAKETQKSPSPNNCENCEVSLRHISEALSKEQMKLEKYENKEQVEAISKWVNFLVILIFGGLVHYLYGLKGRNPDKAEYYEGKISLLNFLWVVVVSGIALIF